MRNCARFMFIAALAILPACAGVAEPELGRVTQAVNEVNVDSIPADLMSCDAFYGQDWDTPDRLIRVTEKPGLVVLVQQQEMVCSGHIDQLPNRLQGVKIDGLAPANGADDSLGHGDVNIGGDSAKSPVEDSNPLPAQPLGGESAESPVDDSNPLPARPVAGESAEAAGPVDDSNPLPATPLGTASASGPTDDSNPLPARVDSTGATIELNGPITE